MAQHPFIIGEEETLTIAPDGENVNSNTEMTVKEDDDTVRMSNPQATEPSASRETEYEDLMDVIKTRYVRTIVQTRK